MKSILEFLNRSRLDEANWYCSNNLSHHHHLRH